MLTKYPNKILRTKSVDVSMEEGQEIAELLKKAIREDCNWGNCVGLAAPQIGLNKNVFIAQGKVYVNPKIIAATPKTIKCKEGCYSLKENGSYTVKRSYAVRLVWDDYMGKRREASFTGFQAEVIQHEYDHLLGKLCCGSWLSNLLIGRR